MDITNEFYLKFLKCLNAADVEYMMIGGYAVNIHGVNRTTADLDLWVNPTNENKEKFIAALVKVGIKGKYIDEIAKEDFTKHQAWQFGDFPFAIDVLTFVHKEISFDSAKEDMFMYELNENLMVNVVGHDTLREIKVRSMRYKDLSDASELDKIKKIAEEQKVPQKSTKRKWF